MCVCEDPTSCARALFICQNITIIITQHYQDSRVSSHATIPLVVLPLFYTSPKRQGEGLILGKGEGVGVLGLRSWGLDSKPHLYNLFLDCSKYFPLFRATIHSANQDTQYLHTGLFTAGFVHSNSLLFKLEPLVFSSSPDKLVFDLR